MPGMHHHSPPALDSPPQAAIVGHSPSSAALLRQPARSTWRLSRDASDDRRHARSPPALKPTGKEPTAAGWQKLAAPRHCGPARPDRPPGQGPSQSHSRQRGTPGFTCPPGPRQQLALARLEMPAASHCNQTLPLISGTCEAVVQHARHWCPRYWKANV